jgi:hypothetical protein
LPTGSKFSDCGYLLTVNKRKAFRYFRIYEKKESNSLRFEFEMKNSVSKKYQKFLFSNNFEDFEIKSWSEFIAQWKNFLPIDFDFKSYSYLDWLVNALRRTKKSRSLKSVIQLESINPNIELNKSTASNALWAFHFFSFLTTITRYEIECMGSTKYRVISFELREFSSNSTKSHYQLKKCQNLMRHLQTNYFVRIFSDNYYSSLVTIPKIEMFSRKKKLEVKVYVADAFFDHLHLFEFPNPVSENFGADESNLYFWVLTQLTNTDTVKTIDLSSYFETFRMSNGRKSKIKVLLLKFLQNFLEFDIIKPECRIDNLTSTSLDIRDLTREHLRNTFFVRENL